MAYIDLCVGTFSCVEDKFSRLQESYFEFYNENEKEFFFEMINVEKQELLKIKLPDTFIPYNLSFPNFDLGKVKGFRLSHFDEEFEDFEIYKKQEREEDSECAELTKETRKLLPVAFYSAQQLSIRIKRGEPIFTLDGENEIQSHDSESELLEQPYQFLPLIKKARNVKKLHFCDGSQTTSFENGMSRFAHAVFEFDDDRESSVDLYCKINEGGFISAGHFVFGSVRTNDKTYPFQMGRTGFIDAEKELGSSFWWSNMFGCKIKEGGKCAVWSQNFKKSFGLNLSYLDISG